MKKLSLRDLARVYLERERLGCQIARQAVERVHADGWVVSHVPAPDDYDRILVLVRQDHHMADLLRSAQNGRVTLPRAVVEQQAGLIGDWEDGGRYLGRHGLAIMHLDDDTVELLGTSADLGYYVNASRYYTNSIGIAATKIVAAAVGRRYPMRRLHEQTRLKAAIIYDQFGVDASDLLEGCERIRLRSAWMMQNGQGVNGE